LALDRSWSEEDKFALCPEGGEAVFLNAGLVLIDKHVSSSIADTVVKLNDGSITCGEEFCVAYSASDNVYCILFKRGQLQAAVDRLATPQFISAPAADGFTTGWLHERVPVIEEDALKDDEVFTAEDALKGGGVFAKEATSPVPSSNVLDGICAPKRAPASKVVLSSDWIRASARCGKVDVKHGKGAQAVEHIETPTVQPPLHGLEKDHRRLAAITVHQYWKRDPPRRSAPVLCTAGVWTLFLRKK
jgi:hypothetical protein